MGQGQRARHSRHAGWLVGMGGMSCLVAAVLLTVAGCTAHPQSSATSKAGTVVTDSTADSAMPPVVASPAPVSGVFSMAFAGDVHFAERTADLLVRDPDTAFGVSANVLSAPDVTMVNLETSISVGGRAESKSFTFQAPPTAFTAMKAAGIDVVTMANNHAADYGAVGLQQTVAAIAQSGMPVVGIGSNAAAAYAPYYLTEHGVRVAILAASQVQDETLAHFSATDTSAGIANAYSPRLLASVRSAHANADVVIVYLHWGTEYQTCPNADQQHLADELAAAGATAIIGTHAHVLQGAGWRADGSYVAYGLGNYFWWRSFGNNQDDNGVLTLTFALGSPSRVTAATFAPAHLDDSGVSPPATGTVADRVLAEWEQARRCTGLSAGRAD